MNQLKITFHILADNLSIESQVKTNILFSVPREGDTIQLNNLIAKHNNIKEGDYRITSSALYVFNKYRGYHIIINIQYDG